MSVSLCARLENTNSASSVRDIDRDIDRDTQPYHGGKLNNHVSATPRTFGLPINDCIHPQLTFSAIGYYTREFFLGGTILTIYGGHTPTRQDSRRDRQPQHSSSKAMSGSGSSTYYGPHRRETPRSVCAVRAVRAGSGGDTLRFSTQPPPRYKAVTPLDKVRQHAESVHKSAQDKVRRSVSMHACIRSKVKRASGDACMHRM